MSVKFSTVMCLSNAVVNVPCNCWELWKQLISSNFQNGFLKIITITVKKIALTLGFFIPLPLNKKIKMKTRNVMAHSHHSKVSSTQNQRVPFFCCLVHGAYHYTFMFGKVKVFPITINLNWPVNLNRRLTFVWKK